MIERSVIVAGRQCGKTYTMMSMIHDLIVEGKRSEILVVFPAANSVHSWIRMWQDRFPFLPMVEYTTSQNLLKIRGAQFGTIFVEDVDYYSEGIYDPKLIELEYHCLRSESEIIYSCSPLNINQRSHSATIKPAAVMERTRRRLFSRK